MSAHDEQQAKILEGVADLSTVLTAINDPSIREACLAGAAALRASPETGWATCPSCLAYFQRPEAADYAAASELIGFARCGYLNRSTYERLVKAVMAGGALKAEVPHAD